MARWRIEIIRKKDAIEKAAKVEDARSRWLCKSRRWQGWGGPCFLGDSPDALGPFPFGKPRLCYERNGPSRNPGWGSARAVVPLDGHAYQHRARIRHTKRG
jgi:hypothetical protein